MQTTQQNTIKVWDPLIRIFHWSLVLLFITSYLSGDEWDTLHIYSGYAISGLLAFRLLWGIIGTRYARFSEFVRGPAEIKAYLKSLLRGNAKAYTGHNPAGGAMIIALLLMLMGTVLSGMALLASDGQGPLASTFFSTWSEDWLEEIHEFFANGMLVLIALHIGGVIISSKLHGENLVRAMFTGRKHKEEN